MRWSFSRPTTTRSKKAKAAGHSPRVTISVLFVNQCLPDPPPTIVYTLQDDTYSYKSRVTYLIEESEVNYGNDSTCDQRASLRAESMA